MFLVRKISRAKWPKGDRVPIAQFRADAITVDLKTHGDALSLWKCESDTDQNVEEIVLAIAGGRDDIGRVQVVLLNDAELLIDGLTTVDTPGKTVVEPLKKLHTDLGPLTYASLGQIADQVDKAIRNGRFRQYSETRVKGLFQAAVDEGRITLDSLPKKIQAKLTQLE